VARERAPEDRAALLAEADPELRREVEALFLNRTLAERRDVRPIVGGIAEPGDATLHRRLQESVAHGRQMQPDKNPPNPLVKQAMIGRDA
jgi:hypothetical protein